MVIRRIDASESNVLSDRRSNRNILNSEFCFLDSALSLRLEGN